MLHRCCFFAIALAASNASAQTPGALNPASHPPHVAPGEALAITRAYAAARHDDAALIAYIDDAPGAHGELRLARMSVTPQGLDRTRPDTLLAPSARTVALVWDGSRGAVAYITAPPPPPQPAPGTPPRRFLPTPPSPAEPLGAAMSSGGEVFVQAIDAEGLATGRPVSVFSEHSHAVRVAVALEGERVIVAWTAEAYTDMEVRETVRAARLGEHLEAPTVVSDTGWFGQTGDALRLRTGDGPTRVYFTGARCATREGSSTPSDPPQDPSARVEPQPRSPQPQASITLDSGPLVECGLLSVHTVALDARGAFGPIVTSAPIAHDTFALTRDAVIAPLGAAPGALAALSLSLDAPRTLSSRAPTAVTVRPYAFTLQSRPTADAEPLVRENPIAAPALSAPEIALHDASLLDTSPDGALVLSIPSDHRRVFVATRAPDGSIGAPTLVWSPASMVLDASVLAGATTFVLARENAWQGPLRVIDPTRAVEAPAVAAIDDTWRMLFARVRTARAIFMRHENTAGALAARPEAPTDPRMPAILSSRNRLRSRWTSLCDQLNARTRWLARQNVPGDFAQAARQVCEIHGDLQLGVPINPAL